MSDVSKSIVCNRLAACCPARWKERLQLKEELQFPGGAGSNVLCWNSHSDDLRSVMSHGLGMTRCWWIFSRECGMYLSHYVTTIDSRWCKNPLVHTSTVGPARIHNPQRPFQYGATAETCWEPGELAVLGMVTGETSKHAAQSVAGPAWHRQLLQVWS